MNFSNLTNSLGDRDNCTERAAVFLSSLEKDSCYITLRFVINTLLAGSICVLGFVGNSVSYAVLKKDKQTPVASILLRALAIADNTFLVWWFVHFSLRDLIRFTGVRPFRNYYWEYTRTYTYACLYIGQTATIWMTVFIAFTRYIAVCWPYSASRICNSPSIKKGVVVIFICSVLYNSPRFFEYRLCSKSLCNQNLLLPDKTALAESATYSLVYSGIMYYIFSFALPLVLLTGLNLKLIIALRAVQNRRSTLRGSLAQASSARDPNITLVMVVVILVFMICNLPARLVQIIWEYEPMPNICLLTYKFYIMELSTLFEVLNSSTNFIIYCVFRHQFRDILRMRLGCEWKQKRHLSCTEGNATETLVNGVTMKSEIQNQVTQL